MLRPLPLRVLSCLTFLAKPFRLEEEETGQRCVDALREIWDLFIITAARSALSNFSYGFDPLPVTADVHELHLFLTLDVIIH